MKVIETILKYIGYATISIGLGWVATLGENDFMDKITTSIIPILLTLTVLHTTLTNLVLNELLKYTAHNNNAINAVVVALKRSAIIELILIILTFVILIARGVIMQWIGNNLYVNVIIYSLVIFDILYFAYVIYDNIEGWYKLIKENNSKS